MVAARTVEQSPESPDPDVAQNDQLSLELRREAEELLAESRIRVLQHHPGVTVDPGGQSRQRNSVKRIRAIWWCWARAGLPDKAQHLGKRIEQSGLERPLLGFSSPGSGVNGHGLRAEFWTGTGR